MGVRGTFKGGVKDNGLILHYDAGKFKGPIVSTFSLLLFQHIYYNRSKL